MKLAFPIDDESKSGAADAQVLDEGVESLEVDRCLDYIKLVADLSLSRNDKVGRSAKTGENVTNEVLADHGLLKPGGCGVFSHVQIERSGVGHLNAVRAHEAQIDERAVILLAHEVEDEP